MKIVVSFSSGYQGIADILVPIWWHVYKIFIWKNIFGAGQIKICDKLVISGIRKEVEQCVIA